MLRWNKHEKNLAKIRYLCFTSRITKPQPIKPGTVNNQTRRRAYVIGMFLNIFKKIHDSKIRSTSCPSIPQAILNGLGLPP